MAGPISTAAAEGSRGLETSSWQSWAVVLAASLFFFYEFIILNIFNTLNTTLVADFHITETQLGNMSAYYFYASILFIFPAGIIIDRVSTRKLILTALSLCVASTFVFSFAPNIFVASLCRFVMGMGGAFCLISAVKLASHWFPADRMAFVMGIVVTIAFIGGMLAQYAAKPIEIYGWRHTIFFIACTGIVMLGLIYQFVVDFPKNYQKTHKNAQMDTCTIPFKTTLVMAAKNLQNWLAGLYTSLINLPVFVLGAFVGSLYLEQVHHLDSWQAAQVSSMIYFGTIFGSPTVGWISDKLRLRKLPMFVFGVLSLIVMLLILMYTNWSYSSLMVLFFLLGFFTSAQIISYALIPESNPAAITATAMGIGSTIIMAGGLSQPFVGWLLDLHWDKVMVEGHPLYTLANFNFALAILPIAFVFGLIACLFTKETRCKAID